MDFFTELRNTARRVERGVRDARQIAEEHHTSNEVDNAGAVVMLRKKNADMKEMKAHSSDMLKKLRQNRFMETVTACEELLEKNLEIMEKTEGYLEQYGYKPLQPPVKELQQQSTEVVEAATMVTGCDSDIVAEAIGGTIETDEPGPSTPNQSMPSSYSLSRTPKMSDFGISESTMQILSHRSHGISETGQDTRAGNNFKMPGEPMSLFKQRRFENQFNEKHLVEKPVPAEFDHDGLLVSPALMPGIMDAETPADYPRRAPYYPSPLYGAHSNISPNGDMGKVKRLHLGSDGSEDSDSPVRTRQASQYDDMDSPIPPVFCTPGVKQLKKHVLESRLDDVVQSSANDTPEPPVFMTPGLRSLSVKQHVKVVPLVEQDNDTPEPPVFMTPGLRSLSVKQHVKVVPLVEQDNDTPEPPVMQTPGVKQLSRAVFVNTNQTAYGSSPAFAPNTNIYDEFNTPEMPELTINMSRYPMTMESVKQSNETETHRKDAENRTVESPTCDFIVQRPVLRSFQDICDTPEAPELTFSYKELLSQNVLSNKIENVLSNKVENVLSNKVEPTSPEVSASISDSVTKHSPEATPVPHMHIRSHTTLPETPQISSRINIDIMETPKLPELTGSYNFQINPTKCDNISNSTIVQENKENHCPSVEPVPVPTIKTATKTALSHSSQPSAPCFTEEIDMCVYIPQVTDAEYMSQPSYIRNLVDQEKMNHSIKILNQVLADRLKVGEAALVSENDLKNQLEFNQIRFTFFSLMRLGRLSQKCIDGNKCYGLSS